MCACARVCVAATRNPLKSECLPGMLANTTQPAHLSTHTRPKSQPNCSALNVFPSISLCNCVWVFFVLWCCSAKFSLPIRVGLNSSTPTLAHMTRRWNCKSRSRLFGPPPNQHSERMHRNVFATHFELDARGHTLTHMPTCVPGADRLICSGRRLRTASKQVRTIV